MKTKLKLKLKTMFKIMYTYNGTTEEIDTATTRKEAEYLLNEYRIAFRDGFVFIK